MATTASKRERLPLAATPNAKLEATPQPEPASTLLQGASVRTITENDIRLRAYQLYLERGETPGDEFNDWVRAEQELLRR